MKTNPVLSRLIVSILLLVLIIATILLSSINVFQPMNLSALTADILYWISLTGSNPFAGLSILVIVVIGFIALPRKKRIPFVLTIGLSLVLLLSLHVVLKPFFQHSRPHIVWLEQQGVLDSQSFYRLDKAQRKIQVQESLQQLALTTPALYLPPAVKRHWQQQVSYSFPSGHMLFATTLFIVAGFYLLAAGHTAFTLLLYCWLFAMACTRLLLGVHWPQDILASILIGSCIGGISLGAINHYFVYMFR